MKQNKYEIIITDPSSNDKITKLFSTREEVANFLEIKVSTIYGLQRNNLKLSQDSKSNLKNIEIKKLKVLHQHNKPKVDTENYMTKIIEKCKI